IAFASRDTARLTERLTDWWGQGISCLSSENEDESDHGIPRSEASLIQRSSRMRVWWGDDAYLDPFLVLETLRHGCLPLQLITQASHDALATRLPRGLSRFTLAIPEVGPVPAISPRDRAFRLDEGLSVLLSGHMERDLAQLIPSLL